MSTNYGWDTVIILVRRMVDFTYPAKMGAKVANEIRDEIRLASRIYRPNMVDFFLSSMLAHRDDHWYTLKKRKTHS